MDDLIQAAKLFANISHQRIDIYRNPRLQSPAVHLKAVAQIVSSVSQDAHMIAATWLHDIVEDTGVTIGDVERKFGGEVAKLVDELTVVGHPAHASRTARFAVEKDHFANVSSGAKTIKLADLIATCRDLHKNEPASLMTYAAEASELTHILGGGDTRLLTRLKRDLDEYASSSLPAESLATSRQFRPIAIPIAALLAFERAFTAVEIAEPLVSFDSNRSSNEILEAMTATEIGVAGLRREGILCGFVEAASLRRRPSEADWRKFAASQMIASESSFMDVIEVLSRHDWCFVTVLGTVVGVISRMDLQKPPMRMWLFGILTAAELEFTERIRRKWPGDNWGRLLSQQRLERATELYAERQRRKEWCKLVDCLQLADKIDILLSDSSELEALGIPTPSAARRAAQQIESLRNSLAHAQSFVEKDWPQVVRLARRIRKIVEGE